MTSNAIADKHEGLREQIERIVTSETFRTSEGLQRLLRYLGEKVASGEARHLKEYTIGVEGLGRPSTYDPGHDAAVRMQVGRLRQKLGEYYSGEGKGDPFLLTLPKGGFTLSFGATFQVTEPAPRPTPSLAPEAVPIHRKRFPVLCAVIFILAAWSVVATTRVILDHRKLSRLADDLTPALQELWQPFLASDRPLLIGIADPQFVEFDGVGFGYYRVPSNSDWRDPQNSARIAAMQQALGATSIRITHRYANLAAVNCAFVLGKFLAPYFSHISLVRGSDLSWQQLAGSNLLFIGGTVQIMERLKSMPAQLEVTYEKDALRIRNPKPGESGLLPDPSPPGSYEEGETFALVTHAPGPDGQGDIETFTSKSAPAEVGAVQWYSSPEHAAYLVTKLRSRPGRIPRYYQLVLKVKFKGGVPTETSYVLHRELRIPPSSVK